MQRTLAHVLYNRLAEFAALYFLRSRHHAGEVVGNSLRADRAFYAADDEVGGFVPHHVAEHHLAGEDHRARVHFVLAGILRRGAVRGFENRVAGHIVDVRAGGDADTADAGRQRVTDIVAVEI